MAEPLRILISGTSRGIGRALAQHFAERGAVVIGCSRGDVTGVDGAYEHFRLDVSSEPAVKEMFRHVRRRHGGLDVLVNSAAINPAIAPAALIPASVFQRVFEVNLLAPIVLSREAIKLMSRGRFGRIVNIGSMATKHEVAGESAYTTMKAGLMAFTRVVAKEVYPLGITCNVVAPSAVDTDLSRQVAPEALAEVLRRNAIPVAGTARDVRLVVEWLIQPESQAVTGQAIFLGGA